MKKLAGIQFLLVALFPAYSLILIIPGLLRNHLAWKENVYLGLLGIFYILLSLPIYLAGQIDWLGLTLLGGFLFFIAITLEHKHLSTQKAGFYLLIGLMIQTIIGLWQFYILHHPRVSSLGFNASPNTFAYAMTCLGLVSISLQSAFYKRLFASLLLVLLIVLSGSRTALLASLLGILLIVFVEVALMRKKQLYFSFLLLIGFIAALTVLPPGKRFLSSLQSVLRAEFSLMPSNLLAASEELEHWAQSKAAIQKVRAESYPGEWLISKRGEGKWPSINRSLRLKTGQLYTMTLELKRVLAAAKPGVLLLGDADTKGKRATAFFVAETAMYESTDYIEVFSVKLELLQDNWQRLNATFKINQPSAWSSFQIGIVPDWNAQTTEAQVLVRAFQVQESSAFHGYIPSYKNDYEINANTSVLWRLSTWRLVLEAVKERPFLGWGQQSISDYYRQNTAMAVPYFSPPHHAHNLYLQLLYERGLIGFIGFLGLVGLVYAYLGRHGNQHGMIVLTCLLLANTTDFLLFNGQILYPLCSLLALTTFGNKLVVKPISSQPILH